MKLNQQSEGSLRIVGLTRYPARGASSRLRFFDLAPVFGAAGEVSYKPFFSDEYVQRIGLSGRRNQILRIAASLRAYAGRVSFLVKQGLSPDAKNTVLIVQVEALPNVPAAIELLLLRFARPKQLIVDLDDANHEVYRAMTSPVAKRLLGTKLEQIWAHADRVVAGSPVLANEVQKHVSASTDVVLIPTVVQPERYSDHDHQQSRDEVVIGWIGSPSTAKHLDHVIPALEEVARTIPLKLKVVGARNAPKTTIPVEMIQWSLESETEAAASFDIGVMPLEDSAFARGKCGYKLLQYMASSVPVIASDVGVNRHIVEGGPNTCGLIADTVQEWTSALTDLAANRSLRAEMGRAGRKRVQDSYSIASITGVWFDVFSSESMEHRAGRELVGKEHGGSGK